jgi:Tfp pilus assembly protein PilV
MKVRRQPVSGFTLVEVALALGVAAFCLTGIFGLLSVGVNSNAASIQQTEATNILSAVVADLRAVPNPLPGGSAQTSVIYDIGVPASVPASSASAPTQAPVRYVDVSGTPVATAAGAAYQLNVWTIPGAGREPTLVRLVLSWPAPAALSFASGSVESVVVLDRN